MHYLYETTEAGPLPFEISEKFGLAVWFPGQFMFKVGFDHCKAIEYERLTEEGKPYQRFKLTITWLNNDTSDFIFNGETMMRLVNELQRLADDRKCPFPSKVWYSDIGGKKIKMLSCTMNFQPRKMDIPWKSAGAKPTVFLGETGPQLPTPLLSKPIDPKVLKEAFEPKLDEAARRQKFPPDFYKKTSDSYHALKEAAASSDMPIITAAQKSK